MRVTYLVHDLNDAAVARRVAMLDHAGIATAVAGFRRRGHAPDRIGGAPATDLGRTDDGRLLARVGSVLALAVRPGRLRRLARDADTIVARNLEMLVLARRVRRPSQRLVYECLDIHRLLLGSGPATRALRALERWALAGVDLVVVSAPRFRDDYFRLRIGHDGPVLLVENKVPALAGARPAAVAPSPAPPWRIGWFGMLRCARSLALLIALAGGSGGAIEVLIAGRPSPGTFDDFDGQIAAAPGVSYLGPYVATDLPRLYGAVHFVWAIDYFEEGLNSAWLLPNRLYEGLANGAVPLALRGIATGDWLERHGVGLLLDDPARDVAALTGALDAAGYDRLRAAVAALPGEAVVMDPAESDAVVDAIVGGGR